MVTSNGYSADMNLTVWNHKEIEAEVVVELTTYYGNNLKISWNDETELEKVNDNLYRFKKVLKAGEQWIPKWTEDYRP